MIERSEAVDWLFTVMFLIATALMTAGILHKTGGSRACAHTADTYNAFDTSAHAGQTPR